ncbi:MAG: diheme cytochrome c [Betaproteobacteria bacterium]|nr:diheme cytochrome c [Betaproteobacteria bacterium]
MKIAFNLLLALTLAPWVALADSGNKYGGENRGKPLQPAKASARWQEECAGCHIAYAPGLLPAASWRKVMASLDKHFGADASLSEAENEDITAFLVNNASNRWSAKSAPLRITESAWFKAKHGAREIAPGVWKRPAIKSPANCQACHAGAAKADFNERRIKIPE